MARVPPAELDKLKREISLERLVSQRVPLAEKGADLVGRCPFHDDKTPSLVVTPSKNLWHCFGCGAGGDIVAWVMKAEGVSFRHAVELLREGAPSSSTVKTAPKLPPPVSLDAEDHALLGQVAGYYHRCLLEDPQALSYVVDKRGLSRAAVEHFKLGLCNRTLGLRLPLKNRADGERVRTRLQALGVLRDTGHEHLRGCVTVPLLDDGAVVGMYGRKVDDRSAPNHLYLPGPHRGVFNREGIASSTEVILCEALIDALTFWSAGFRNVTTSYGVEGFTDELLAAFKAHGVQRVLVAYDRDDAGDAAAAKLMTRLRGEGIECVRVLFPRGMDANSYALKVQPAQKSLRVVVEQATFEGKPAPAPPTATTERATEAAKEEDDSPLAASVSSTETPVANETTPVAPASVEKKGDDEIVLRFGERRYRARGVEKNLSREVLKVNLFASLAEVFHVDNLDLYSAKQRAAFIQQASKELRLDVETVRRDVGRLLLILEEHNDAAITRTLAPKDKGPPTMTTPERDAAMALLSSPDLMARVLKDFDACGVVGEKVNKLVGYLASVSRKLDDPLAIIVQSSSAAGKSSLMEAVLAFVPDEEKVKYSAMTGQSLFYMSESNLQHKVLAIVEEEGAERASYALKLLQSEKELTIAATGKDAQTGKLVTHEYRVEGPVMIFLTTTAIEVDEELLNRCLVLTVDENREQTRAIHVLQRKRETLSGLLAREEKQAIVALHKNAQRLLRPLSVVNPFAEGLTFLDDKTRTRRDHMKYLGLIRSIALVHQHQRTIHTVQHRGRALEYIEATVEDVALANVLCHEVLGRTLDELPPQTRKLLLLLDGMVRRLCAEHDLTRSELRFTRRDALDATGFGLTQLRLHLERLVELELVLVHRGMRGLGFVYELIWDGDAERPHLPGLVDVEEITKGRGLAGMSASWRGLLGELAGSWRGHGAPMAAGWRGPVVDDEPPQRPENAHSTENRAHRTRSRTGRSEPTHTTTIEAAEAAE